MRKYLHSRSLNFSMRSAECQTTVPLKFLIIIHNYANVWKINRSKSLPEQRVVSSEIQVSIVVLVWTILSLHAF